MTQYSDIKSVRDFKSLIKYLRTQLDWPVDEQDADDLFFEYDPHNLGLDEKAAVKIRQVKQLRPLVDNQPWGIFWIDFEPKRLPVVVMRRVLGNLVMKKRGRRDAHQASWDLNDLMFISATGEGLERGISFAHFQDTLNGLPQLRTFSWDAHENHFYHLERVNLERLRWPENVVDLAGWRTNWAKAFTTEHREVITSSQVLASRMARLASATRSLVNDIFKGEQPKGPLHNLYNSFKKVLIHDLSVDDFADMYAQTVTYGLFSAFTANPHSDEVRLEKIEALIPRTNPFLGELFVECVRVGTEEQAGMDLDELGLSELMALLSQTKMETILQDFGRQTRNEDPVIHFYESFLHEYDAEMKAQRGVFYTPDPVVSFIVRSVDYLLREELDCPDGFADIGMVEWKGRLVPKVQVLDPATGTGTFLKYVIKCVYETFHEKNRRFSHKEIDQRWNQYVSTHLLPRIYGFELMMAPYTVAHLKLGLFLQEYGYKDETNERLRVFLTNTLQSVNEIPRTESPLLSEEADQANIVKNDCAISVVIGNPPYSYESKNNGDWISQLVKEYYQIESLPLNEKNPKGLQDDYVKFFRFGQWRIDQTGMGILAMITNNAYLDNPTFRGMRSSLSKSFSKIFILNLHGNSNIGEVIPEGQLDKNVFDIQQGVAICLMIKKAGNQKDAEINYADLYGSIEEKNQELILSSVKNLQWTKLNPSKPNYMFVPIDRQMEEEYNRGWRLTDIFPVTTVGLYSARDKFAICWSEKELKERLDKFVSMDEAVARSTYNLGDDSEDWQVKLAQNDIRNNKKNLDLIQNVSYRPFDTRFTFYSGVSKGFLCRPRPEVLRHMLRKNNLALCFVRRSREKLASNFFVARHVIDKTILSSADNSNISPLYLYEEYRGLRKQETLFQGEKSEMVRANISKELIQKLSLALGLRFSANPKGDLKTDFGPEDLFSFVYAICNSPRYRERYSELITRDYPKVPFTDNISLFRALARKGSELIKFHLLESVDENLTNNALTGWAENGVSSGYPIYRDNVVWINAQQGFKEVSEEIWNFHIGGYQVCEKWLKDRRGRQLTSDDISHYQKIIVAIQETIRLMGEIDEVIEEHGGWPIQ